MNFPTPTFSRPSTHQQTKHVIEEFGKDEHLVIYQKILPYRKKLIF